MIQQWLTSPECANIVKALLHTLWQGAAAAVLLSFGLRRMENPVARYRCSLAALGGVLLAGLVTWAVLNRPAPPSISAKPAPSIPTISPPTEPNQLPPLVVHFSPVEPKPMPLPWSAWLALGWLAGATGMIFRGGFKVAGAERLRHASRPLDNPQIASLLADARRAVGLTRRIRLAATDQLTSPAVVGVLVPTLILPLSLMTTLTHEQLRFILLHELAHIRRGDYLASLFQLFAEALLFFNPAVWWISRQMRIEREACCDALAIELSGAPVAYAKTLVAVAETVLSPAPTAALAFGDQPEPTSLRDRVQRLLVPGYRPALRLTWRAMLMALVVGGGLLFLSAVGTRVTVAAILSPQERIERIEKKMTELGEGSDLNLTPEQAEQAPKVEISGQVRVEDGAPLPKYFWLQTISMVKYNSSGSSTTVNSDGNFQFMTRPGQLILSAEIPGYAPAQIGPLMCSGTNRIDNLELVIGRGFTAAIEVTEAGTGKPLASARVETRHWLRGGNQTSFRETHLTTDEHGMAAMTNAADLPLEVKVNAPGHEILTTTFPNVKSGQPLKLELRPGKKTSGLVLDKVTGQPIAGATVQIRYENGPNRMRYEWDDPTRLVARSDASGRFTVDQLRSDTIYWLGISMPEHESVILERVRAGNDSLVARLGPELVVKVILTGDLSRLAKSWGGQGGKQISYVIEQNFGDDRSGFGHNADVKITNGIGYFQFTNRAASRVQIEALGNTVWRDITAPVENWQIEIAPATAAGSSDATQTPKREVVFRFQPPSGVPPRGTVEVDNQELQITNSQVRLNIPIGSRTQIEPKRMVGYWFDHWNIGRDKALWIEVTNGPGPLVVDIPLIPAGAIYAKARNTDGTLAGGLLFGVTEIKRAPGRGDSTLDGGSDSNSGTAPRQWVSGPLPLGGTYQIHGWRGNSFCVSQPINLTEAQPDAEVELQFSPGKTFDGALLDPEGKPVRDAEVKVSFNLADNHGFGLKSVFTDERGRFQFENLTPGLGEYFVTAETPGAMAERVKLKFGPQPQIIRLQPGHILAGRVVEAGTGYPIPGMEVRAMDYERSNLPMVTTKTDADGFFKFTSLGDANYAFYPNDAQLLGDHNNNAQQRFHADGRTNLTLKVKLYEWSKVKAKVPDTAVAATNVTGILMDPNFRKKLQALEQRNGSETLPEPEVTTTSGRGINKITLPTISMPVTEDADQLTQDGKLLYEMGKRDAATAKLKAALALETNNATALYYLNLAQATSAPPQLVYTALGRQKIVTQLEQIKFDQFGPMEGLPLAEVVRQVAAESKQRDPDGKGPNFVINPNPDWSGQPGAVPAGFILPKGDHGPAGGGVDPATGLPTAPVAEAGGTNSEAVDLGAFVVKLPSLTDVKLVDVLAAVVRGASEPIHYSVQDFGIVFAPGKLVQPLSTRTFEVDTNSFLNALRKGTGRQTNSIPVTALSFFSTLGVDWKSPQGKTMFYSDSRGQLYVRATEADLDKIERAIQELNSTPPQIHLKARFIEVAQNDREPFGFSAFLGQVNSNGATATASSVSSSRAEPNTASQPASAFPGGPAVSKTAMATPGASITGILTAPNFGTVMEALRQRGGFKILGEPEASTTSGRTVQMRQTTRVTIVTNFALLETATNTAMEPQTSVLETGPILETTATVLADGYTIDLPIQATITEFLGYEQPTNSIVLHDQAGRKISVPAVQPRVAVRQAGTHIKIWDGQTVVLGGLISTSVQTTQSQMPLLGNLPLLEPLFRHEAKNEIRKNLMIFVTATLVDSADNRIHTDEDLPFAQCGVPPQSSPAK